MSPGTGTKWNGDLLWFPHENTNGTVCGETRERDSHPSCCPRDPERTETTCGVDLITESTWQKLASVVSVLNRYLR